MTTQSDEKRNFTSAERWLSFAALLGPLAALTHLSVSDALVPTACAHGSKAMLHASAAAFLVIALAGAAIGWRACRRYASAPLDGEDHRRWLAVAAVCLSISSAVAIIAMEIPNVILRSCD
jgi:hypothetical protein